MTKTVAFTSGKGGVGKTSLLVNTSLALAERGRRVLILDGDLGMANVDLFFGQRSEHHLLEVLRGEKDLRSILSVVAPGVTLIPGGSGIAEYNSLSAFERRALLDVVQELDFEFDYLLIDTAPGLGEHVLQLNAAAQMSAVVITPDPSSFTDAYALIKVLNHQYRETHFSIIANMVRDEAEGFHLYQRFSDVTARFLNIGLDYWGSIPTEQQMKRHTHQQKLIMKHDNTSITARQFQNLAQRIEGTMTRLHTKSGLQFFWDQVVGVA